MAAGAEKRKEGSDVKLQSVREILAVCQAKMDVDIGIPARRASLPPLPTHFTNLPCSTLGNASRSKSTSG